MRQRDIDNYTVVGTHYRLHTAICIDDDVHLFTFLRVSCKLHSNFSGVDGEAAKNKCKIIKRFWRAYYVSISFHSVLFHFWCVAAPEALFQIISLKTWMTTVVVDLGVRIPNEHWRSQHKFTHLIDSARSTHNQWNIFIFSLIFLSYLVCVSHIGNNYHDSLTSRLSFVKMCFA